MKIDMINVGEALFLLLLLLRCNAPSSAKYLNHSKSHVNVYYPRSSSTRRSRPSDRIAGGYNVDEGEFPPFVSLMGQRGHSYAICSGVAVTDRLILTAAHCFYPDPYPWDRIVAVPGVRIPEYGEVKKQGFKTYSVEKLCGSPLFSEQNNVAVHDYQILRLKTPISGIEYASLASSEARLGDKAIAVGAGMSDDSNDNPTYPNRVQALPVRRVPCDARGKPSHICFQSYDPEYVGDTCPGDSGGPIFMRGKQGNLVVVGLTSFGEPVCMKGYNGVSFNANVYTGLEEIQKLANACS